jgi:hypothetical protein
VYPGTGGCIFCKWDAFLPLQEPPPHLHAGTILRFSIVTAAAQTNINSAMAASREVYMLDSDSDDEAFTKYRGVDEDVGSEDESDDERAHAHGPERMTNDSSDDDGSDSGFDNFDSSNSDFDDDDSSNDNDDDEEEGEYGLGDEDGSNSEEAELSTKAKWAKRRQQIINMLLDDNHDIHLLTGKTKKEHCERIWQKYASEFDKSLVTNSLSRCLLQLKRGELKSSKRNTTKDGKPFWKSRSKASVAFGLLYRIRLNTPLARLGTDKVHKQHNIFHQYNIEDFRKYDKEMIKLTARVGARMQTEINEWNIQRAVAVKKNTTSRGKRM